MPNQCGHQAAAHQESLLALLIVSSSSLQALQAPGIPVRAGLIQRSMPAISSQAQKGAECEAATAQDSHQHLCAQLEKQ